MKRYASLFLIATIASIFVGPAHSAHTARAADRLLLEAENFNDCGGWVVDQQFMDQMGSPYLLAHGLGDPVRDAVTVATFPSAGAYRVWVRTHDWVAPWKAPGAPGRFQVLIDGKPLATTFGTEGAAWHWQDGGTVKLPGQAKVALHDLTGFEGRCDAILFCRDLQFQPPNDGAVLAKLRRELLGLPQEPDRGGRFDLVVVGGGIPGTATAISAARLGLTVALIQDRPVLGGNGSSEIRVWPEGKIHQAPYRHIGDVVAELVPEKRKADSNAKSAEIYADARKLAVVRAEPHITLLLEQRVNAVEARDGLVRAVVCQHIRTARRLRIEGRWFADCTGDGTVGFLAGADYDVTRQQHMGSSNLWNVADTGAAEPFPKCLCQDNDPLDKKIVAQGRAAPFPRCPWAVDLKDKDFPGRNEAVAQWCKPGLGNLGNWFWESGFDRDPIEDIEWTRDLNLRAMYGAWDTLKNVDGKYPHHKLAWAAYIAGKRESRRLLGDVVLTADNFRQSTPFADACFPCTWHIDIHAPEPRFAEGHAGEEFISRATEGKKYSYAGPYWVPYRCLYSRNIGNLFMAGRDISVTHEAMGPIREMQTGGMMGEVVGMAAALCKQFDCTPREVYARHLDALQKLLTRGVVANAGSVTALPRGLITGGAQAVYDPSLPEELRVRDGLPNLFAKLEAGKSVRIAYLGGSITAANGWRPKTLAWFQAQFPKAEVLEINAAISGTGSDYGACRIAVDVLDKHPDLVFLEHRVNGGGGFEAKSVEGIVRQIWKKNPRIDICLVYTTSEWLRKDIQSGKTPRFGAIMETVANAYGIPSIDLGVEIARREKAGSLVFKASAAVAGKLVFSADGTHPGDAGHAVYRDVIARSMLVMQPVGKAGARVLPAPLESGCWETASLLPIPNAVLSAGWTTIDTAHDPVYRDDFGRTQAMLRGGVKCARAGETITLKWNGTTLGFSDIPQGTDMEVEVTIDKAAPISIKRTQTEKVHRYARFFYLPEQAPGEHTAVFRVKTLPPGLCFYAGQVLVVGKAAL